MNLREIVWVRAGHRCEYCHLLYGLYDTPFSVDHIIAQQHGGKTKENNLALACMHCNLHKGPNIAGLDPESGRMKKLFNPRKQSWQDHFK